MIFENELTGGYNGYLYLYNGTIYPAEQVCITTEKYQVIQNKLTALQHEVEEKLDQPLKNTFDAFLEQQNAAFSIEVQETFAYGFRLGMNLLLEALEYPPEGS